MQLQCGDKVNVSLDGEVEEVTIIDSLKTQDYSSYIVVVSNTLFESEKYRKVCTDFDLSESVSLDDVRDLVNSAVNIQARDDLILQWQETIVSGIDMIIWICVIIAIALLIMLNNSICSSILDRKQELSLLRTIGLSKKGMLHLLYTEIAMFHTPSLIFAALVTPLISKTFVELSAVMSNYDVEYHCEGVVFLIIFAVIVVLLLISPLTIFNKIKNQSPTEGLKYTT